MKTTEAIKFFGTKAALARALEIERQSIHSWKKLVPYARQLRIESITNGQMKAMSWPEYFEATHKAA